MARIFSDEVWAQLDPRAGRLSRRAKARVWLAGALALALAVGFVAIWRAGLIAPRLGVEPGVMSYDEAPGGQITFTVTIENRGRFPVSVLKVGGDEPGLRLVRVEGDLPTTLDPGQRASVTLEYRITDCGVVPDDLGPVPVRVERPWGDLTAHLRPEYGSLRILREIAKAQCG